MAHHDELTLEEGHEQKYREVPMYVINENTEASEYEYVFYLFSCDNCK
jgi:hypothetical protein